MLILKGESGKSAVMMNLTELFDGRALILAFTNQLSVPFADVIIEEDAGLDELWDCIHHYDMDDYYYLLIHTNKTEEELQPLLTRINNAERKHKLLTPYIIMGCK